MNHLIIAPILIPLLGAAFSLVVEHRRFGSKIRRTVAWTSTTLLLISVIALFLQVSQGEIQVYLLGDWPSRLGISLVADRLTGLMLLVTQLLAIASLLHACSGWDRRAPHFHALFQFQLMGINGAFLTGDIFNLFVFFEIMLIASYGLLISAGRGLRIRISFHYVLFNITASTLFLIALGFIYGLLGSLNMAELSIRIAQAAPQDLALIKAAIGLLLLVFCSKAALLPLYLWLPGAYSRAPAAVAALFVIMTKVGLYAVLRTNTLLLSADAGAMAGYARPLLLIVGIIMLMLAALGVLAAVRLRILVAYLVLVSSATLFIAFSLQQPLSLAAGLYYLIHSTFIAAALFLIADLIRRRRGQASDHKETVAPLPDKSISSILFLVAAIFITGLPPFSGFLGKAALLMSVPAPQTFIVWTAILVSSLMVIIGMMRAGIRLFWKPTTDPFTDDPITTGVPVRRLELAATLLLLGYALILTFNAADVFKFTQETAEQLLDPAAYIQQLHHTSTTIREP